ncbi:MAG: fibronectin type III domain-containing protein [Coriobacteriia bacterium]|nr:fibronectin type III domain-containing protein [Coriobacteriia bacterium]
MGKMMRRAAAAAALGLAAACVAPAAALAYAPADDLVHERAAHGDFAPLLDGTDYHAFVKPATPSANGGLYTRCRVCGFEEREKVIYRPKTVRLSASAYTYSGAARKPSVTVLNSAGKALPREAYELSYAPGRKLVGSYGVTVTFKGDWAGTMHANFTIKPKATTLRSLKAAKGGFAATWSRAVSQADGYQVRYSRYSSMKGYKKVTVAGRTSASKKVTGLASGKRYYVQVRVYKKAGGATFVSAWSPKKSVVAR